MSDLARRAGAVSRAARVRRRRSLAFWLAQPTRGAWRSVRRRGGRRRSAAHLGRRASREGARGHGVGAVPADAASAVSRLDAHRRRPRDRVGERWRSRSLVVVYLALTLTARRSAARRAHLTEKFGAAYPEYREGRATGGRSAVQPASARLRIASIARSPGCCSCLRCSCGRFYNRMSLGEQAARAADRAAVSSVGRAPALHAGCREGGRLAPWYRTSFTRRLSGVRSPYRPMLKSMLIELHSATRLDIQHSASQA